MLITATHSCPYHLALVFDEMSSIFNIRIKKNLNGHKLALHKQFLSWVCDSISSYFEQYYVVDECKAKWPALKFEYLYALNDESEMDTGDKPALGMAIDVASGTTNLSAK